MDWRKIKNIAMVSLNFLLTRAFRFWGKKLNIKLHVTNGMGKGAKVKDGNGGGGKNLSSGDVAETYWTAYYVDFFNSIWVAQFMSFGTEISREDKGERGEAHESPTHDVSAQ